jgi:hypothetical protein
VADDGNANGIESGDEVYLDNGDKTSVQKHIAEMFYGNGGYTGRPQGTDRYPPINTPAVSDSWVVYLPVVECQDASRCAGGTPFAIVGGVCFEIREVTGPPARKVKGRFLCPDDPATSALYEEYCGDLPGDRDATGGCNFGDRAEEVVLVE